MATGKTDKCKDLDSIILQMEIYTKENGKMVWNKVSGKKFITKMEKYMLAILKTVKDAVMDDIIIKMGTFTSDNSQKTWSKGEVVIILRMMTRWREFS